MNNIEIYKEKYIIHYTCVRIIHYTSVYSHISLYSHISCNTCTIYRTSHTVNYVHITIIDTLCTHTADGGVYG